MEIPMKMTGRSFAQLSKLFGSRTALQRGARTRSAVGQRGQMKQQDLGGVFCVMLLASALGVAGKAQSYFATVSGAPSSISCTSTSVSWNSPGLNLSWNLPPASQVRSVEMVGALVVDDSKDTVGGPDFPAVGSIPNVTNVTTWPTPVTLPYTYSNSYTPLYPGAGTSSISFDCVGGVGTNFRISNGPPFGFAPVAGVWWDPKQDGSGYGLDYHNGMLVVETYSYLAGGPAQWYLSNGPVNNNVFTGPLEKYIGGQCISCPYTGKPTTAGNDGTMTITFTSPTTANVSLPGGRQTQIQWFFQP
jgi:hypothetical protein